MQNSRKCYKKHIVFFNFNKIKILSKVLYCTWLSKQSNLFVDKLLIQKRIIPKFTGQALYQTCHLQIYLSACHCQHFWGCHTQILISTRWLSLSWCIVVRSLFSNFILLNERSPEQLVTMRIKYIRSIIFTLGNVSTTFLPSSSF